MNTKIVRDGGELYIKFDENTPRVRIITDFEDDIIKQIGGKIIKKAKKKIKTKSKKKITKKRTRKRVVRKIPYPNIPPTAYGASNFMQYPYYMQNQNQQNQQNQPPYQIVRRNPEPNPDEKAVVKVETKEKKEEKKPKSSTSKKTTMTPEEEEAERIAGEKIERLVNELKELAREKGDMGDEIFDLNTNVAKLKRELNDLEYEKEEKEDEISKLIDDKKIMILNSGKMKVNTAIQKKINNDKIKKILNDLKHKEKELNETNDEIQKTRNEIDDMKRLIEEKNKEVNELNSNIEKKKNEIMEMKNELDESNVNLNISKTVTNGMALIRDYKAEAQKQLIKRIAKVMNINVEKEDLNNDLNRTKFISDNQEIAYILSKFHDEYGKDANLTEENDEYDQKIEGYLKNMKQQEIERKGKEKEKYDYEEEEEKKIMNFDPANLTLDYFSNLSNKALREFLTMIEKEHLLRPADSHEDDPPFVRNEEQDKRFNSWRIGENRDTIRVQTYKKLSPKQQEIFIGKNKNEKYYITDEQWIDTWKFRDTIELINKLNSIIKLNEEEKKREKENEEKNKNAQEIRTLYNIPKNEEITKFNNEEAKENVERLKEIKNDVNKKINKYIDDNINDFTIYQMKKNDKGQNIFVNDESGKKISIGAIQINNYEDYLNAKDFVNEYKNYQDNRSSSKDIKSTKEKAAILYNKYGQKYNFPKIEKNDQILIAVEDANVENQVKILDSFVKKFENDKKKEITEAQMLSSAIKNLNDKLEGKKQKEIVPSNPSTNMISDLNTAIQRKKQKTEEQLAEEEAKRNEERNKKIQELKNEENKNSNLFNNQLLDKFKSTKSENIDNDDNNDDWIYDWNEINTEKNEQKIENVQEFIDEVKNIENVTQGSGKNDGGLFNYEIANIMRRYRRVGFKGVFAVDQLHMIPLKKSQKIISFVMNTEPITTPNGHWVAVVLTPDNLEYYDSFGEEPNKQFLKNMKRLAQVWAPDKLLQFKINRVKFQKTNTDNCGYFAMKFIKDRHDGKNFIQATGFDIINKAMKGEKEIEKFKSKIKQFGKI